MTEREKNTSHSTVQDQVMFMWTNHIQVLSLEMLRINPAKQQQRHC